MISLWLDEHVFLRSVWRRLFSLVILVLAVTASAFVLAGLISGFSEQSGKILSELFATQVGAVDLEPEATFRFWGRFLFHLFCVLAFGGLLVSILCSAVETHEERVRAGLIRYGNLSGHYIVIGWSDLTPELVSRLLAGEMDGWHPGGKGRPPNGVRPRLVLFTSSDVATVRSELEERLPPDDFRRIVFYFGAIDFNDTKRQWDKDRIDRMLEDVGAVRARQVFLLAERTDPLGRDVKLLAFARMLALRIQKAPNTRSRLGLDPVLPVFAELDARGSLDIVQKFPTSPVGTDGSTEKAACVYFRPFSIHEMWAARLFSPDCPTEIRPLLYRPPIDGDSVHLVVVGFTRMGCALVEQALRSCHYPGSLRARITVVDRCPVEEPFRARHPDLNQIDDIQLEFIVGDIASPKVRNKTIRQSAIDPRVMLTVAVCVENPDESLSISLNLPREVYQWKKEEAPVRLTHRTRWKPDGNNVWVRQNLVSGFSDALSGDKGRFKWVSPFGMPAAVLSDRAFAEHAAIVRGYMYRQHKATGSKEPNAPEHLVEELKADTRKLLDESFAVFLDSKKTIWPHRWASIHATDTVVSNLKFLGFRTVSDHSQEGAESRTALDVGKSFRQRLEGNLRVFPTLRETFITLAQKKGFEPDAFAEAEHRRWMADRTLAGFRQTDADEKRDDEFLIHDKFLPFAEIDTKYNDWNNILAIPVFLALEGYRIEEERSAEGQKNKESCSKA